MVCYLMKWIWTIFSEQGHFFSKYQRNCNINLHSIEQIVIIAQQICVCTSFDLSQWKYYCTRINARANGVLPYNGSRVYVSELFPATTATTRCVGVLLFANGVRCSHNIRIQWETTTAFVWYQWLQLHRKILAHDACACTCACIVCLCALNENSKSAQRSRCSKWCIGHRHVIQCINSNRIVQAWNEYRLN